MLDILSKLESFYKSHKEILKITMVIVLIMSLIIAVRSCKNNQIHKEELKILNDSLNIKFTTYKDSDSLNHAEIRTLNISLNDAVQQNKRLGEYYEKKIDSFSKRLNIKSKQLNQYITIKTKVEGKGEGKIDTIVTESNIPNTKPDTTYKIFSTDGYLTYIGTIGPGKFGYYYTYLDTLNLISYYKKKGLLGLSKEEYYNVYSANPNAKIIGLEQFSQIPRNNYKRFAVILGTSYGVNNSFKLGWQPINITIGYKLIEF